MITFSDLLVRIGARLLWPIALLMVSILLCGSLYLLIFYREQFNRWLYCVLHATYLAGVAALLWALSIIVPEIFATRFVPDTAQLPAMVTGAIPTLIIISVPLIAVYRHAFRQLGK